MVFWPIKLSRGRIGCWVERRAVMGGCIRASLFLGTKGLWKGREREVVVYKFPVSPKFEHLEEGLDLKQKFPLPFFFYYNKQQGSIVVTFSSMIPDKMEGYKDPFLRGRGGSIFLSLPLLIPNILKATVREIEWWNTPHNNSIVIYKYDWISERWYT